MSDIQYGKIRLEVPSALAGQTATLTTLKGVSRSVTMQSPKTDVYLAGLEQYRVQGGFSDETVSLDFGEMKKVEIFDRDILKKLPYRFYLGCAVVYHDEIHIMGGERQIIDGVSDYSPKTSHYKWNGEEWVSVSTLPFSLYKGHAVVYNDEIHIMGGYNGLRNHYKWDGTTWTSVSTLPVDAVAEASALVIYQNQMHLIRGYSSYSNNTISKYVYKWNGSTWTQALSMLPYGVFDQVYNPCYAVVYSSQIHIFGGGGSTGPKTAHYKWNGSTWTNVSTLPYDATGISPIVYNNSLYILGGSFYTYVDGVRVLPYGKNHYKWNGSGWVSVSTLPYDFGASCAVVREKNKDVLYEIVILGSYTSTEEIGSYAAQWDGNSWCVATD